MRRHVNAPPCVLLGIRGHNPHAVAAQTIQLFARHLMRFELLVEVAIEVARSEESAKSPPVGYIEEFLKLSVGCQEEV